MAVVTLDIATQLINHYVTANQPVMVWGAPGVGKSDVVAQHVDAERAADPAYGFIDKRIALLQPVDLNGLPVVDHANKTAVWYAPDWLPVESRDGPRGTLFLDEVNAGTVAAMSALYELVLNRRLGAYHMPAGWRIVAAGNRQSDRAAAQKMPSALANRFKHIEVEAEINAWADWAARNASKVPAVGVAFLRFRPALLHVMPGVKLNLDGAELMLPGDAVAFPTPRSWVDAFQHVMAPQELRMNLIAGAVGDGPALEFEGFIRTFLELPSISSIFADPDAAKVPTSPAGLYAVSLAVARKSTMSTFKAALDYAKRLPDEFSTLLAHDATTRDKGLTETAAYVGWCNRNVETFA